MIEKHALKAIKKALQSLGHIDVVIDCGHDSQTVFFPNWETKPTVTPAKQQLKQVIAKQLQLPWASPQQANGTGKVYSGSGGAILLKYSMQEIDSCEVPIELINQPVPDVAHVAISPEGEFVDKDFELRIAISRFNFTHDWWKTNSYYTVPDFVPQLKQRVLDFVLPMFQPALDNLAEDESEIEEGTVSVHGIDLTGYYWTSSNEFYYSLELTKARVSRRIKNDIVELFPSG